MHPTLEEFKSEGFTLKTHQMFSIYFGAILPHSLPQIPRINNANIVAYNIYEPYFSSLNFVVQEEKDDPSTCYKNHGIKEKTLRYKSV